MSAADFEAEGLYGTDAGYSENDAGSAPCRSRPYVITVTSCKGGVGKSTVSANLGAALALLGYKTLVMDCDFSMRSLGLIMGLQSFVLYDMYDVLFRNIGIEKASVCASLSEVFGDNLVTRKKSRNTVLFEPLQASERLFLLSCPYDIPYPDSDDGSDIKSDKNEAVNPEHIEELIMLAKEKMDIDYIVIDTPGKSENDAFVSASLCDTALILATHQPASLRAAERTGAILGEAGAETRRLIINFYDIPTAEIACRGSDRFDAQMCSILESIDRTHIRLGGIIPFDDAFVKAQNSGDLVYGASFRRHGKIPRHAKTYRSADFCAGAQGIINTARRITGESVPLFSDFRDFKKYRKSLNIKI